MAGIQKRAALAILLISFLLLACDVGVASGDPPSSSAVKHETPEAVHVRKLLNITAATMATAVEKRVTGPGKCSEDAVVVSQDKDSPMPNGITSYSVTITNTCLGCTVRNVHVSCGEFASTELVDPSDFRRVAVGDCLVRDGGAMGPGDTVSFEYSNSFQYELGVASATCS